MSVPKRTATLLCKKLQGIYIYDDPKTQKAF